MIVYLRNCICVVKRDRLCRCKGRAKHIWPSQNGSNDKENISWSKLGIMIFKCATVYATLLASWIEAESRAFEVFFRIGWYYGLIMFAMWLILSFAVEIKAKATKVVKFPSMNFMGVLFDKPNPDKHVNLTTSQIARRNFRSISRVCLYVFMAVHWIVSLIVGSFTASELGLSIGTSTVSLLIMTAGLVYSYYMVFSSNKPPSHCKDQNLDDASRTKLTMLGLNYPTATDVAHNCVAFLVFVLVLALTLTATTQFTDDLKNGNSCRTKRSTLTTFASNNFDDTRYDICSHRWFNLSIVDLAILADIPYFELNKDGEIQECNDRNINYGSLNRLFPEWKWQIRGRQGETDQVGFYELYSQENNVTVLTVRGTRFSATQDLLQDVDLYTEVVCLQFFSLFVPLTTLLPVDTIADIVYYSSFLERTIYHTGRHYHTAMNNYVQQHSPQWGGRAVITGHSLGGSVGKISGSQYGIRTFAFNSPGLLFSRRKFGLSKDDINKAVVNIAAKLDVVSEVDRLGGSSNRIGCSSNSVVTCHRLTNMICDLVHYCQDSSIAAQIACV
ncbi:uncharacterized protein LOC134189977 [Corticium candelabrum]|uniref:uncharacterized protein LOC134189977 n=1 Tax=Corticium candelabrum TaxID=121492 RepID=UPI002E27215B|nr:uncharacterized protein LOC134189977 [Corticium candelabrum]